MQISRRRAMQWMAGAASAALPKEPWLAALASLERTLASYERNFNGQYEVIKEAMQNHSKSLERAVSGYAPVRPVLPPAAPAAPMIVEHAAVAPPAPPSDTLGSIAALLNNPAVLNNLFMIAQNVVTMFRSATAASAAAVGGSTGAAP